jgi:hypothetical protein
VSGSNPLAAARVGIPAMPAGVEVAAYATYLEAQRAVDHLSDEGFPVQHLNIVGSDLRSVERVTGRLTYARAALAGLVTGVWWGLFAGLLLSRFATGATGASWFATVLIGAGFGILFGVISHALSGGRRDFTSVNAILAARYSVLCAEGDAARARQMLLGLEGVRPLPPQPPYPPQPPLSAQ